MGDCPIRWKEMYIERGEGTGTLTRLLGRLLLILLAASVGWSAVLAVWTAWRPPEALSSAAELRRLTAAWIGGTSLPVSWLVQWAIGIRAAVGITSEKERGTWDPLLLSLLKGSQIVRAKMIASLYGLRWLLAGVLAIWSLGAVLGAMEVRALIELVFGTLVRVAFMAAAGVLCSLRVSTAGRALTFTLATWLVAQLTTAVLAFFFVIMHAFAWLLVWLFAQRLGITALSTWGPPSPGLFATAMLIVRTTLYGLAAVAAAAYGYFHFDHLAGRKPVRSLRASFGDA